MNFKILDKNISQLGEGLCVNHKHGIISWVDIENNKICYFFPKKNLFKSFNYSCCVSQIFYCDTKQAILLDEKGISYFFWEDQSTKKIFDLTNIIQQPFRGNDGIMLSPNNFLFGIMHKVNPKKNIGSVWLVNELGLKKICDMHIPNSFIKISDFILISDSEKNIIYKYSIKLKKILDIWLTYNSEVGSPDGGFFSDENFCYFSIWGESKLVKLDINGNQMDELILPVNNPTNCKQFGKKIIVTSALVQDTQIGLKRSEFDGNLLEVDLF
jgi:sugar lactone lactonase YvrE